MWATVLPAALSFNVGQLRVQPRAAPRSSVPFAAVEEDVVPVPPAFFEATKGHLNGKAEYDTMYARSIEDPAGFWGDIASEFHWEKKWDTVVDSNFAAVKLKPVPQ